MDIENPKPFDIYYFVELNAKYKDELEQQIKNNYPNKKSFVIKAECNDKLIDLADYLKKNKTYRALAFIDPYGMSIKWTSIEALKGLGVDLWILVPTGIGANRLLKTDGKISIGWYNALETFMGLSRHEINKRFYTTQTFNTLFGDESITKKQKDSINKLGDLYAQRLGEIFKHVSKPFALKNRMNSIMYHFMMATNNQTGLKIANDVIKPKYEQ